MTIYSIHLFEGAVYWQWPPVDSEGQVDGVLVQDHVLAVQLELRHHAGDVGATVADLAGVGHLGSGRDCLISWIFGCCSLKYEKF